jgi:chemotaxis response regulator CheB
MLKALIVDANAMSRGLLNTVLADGSYEVVAQTHTGAQGLALALKHQPHLVCVAREQVEDGSQVVEQLRAQLPKAIIFDRNHGTANGAENGVSLERLDDEAVHAAREGGLDCRRIERAGHHAAHALARQHLRCAGARRCGRLRGPSSVAAAHAARDGWRGRLPAR